MLRTIRSSDDRFKPVDFHAALNIVVAKKGPDAGLQDTRNAVGKSSVVELLHFLLGASSTKSLFTCEALRRHSFLLTMDWPRGGDGTIEIERSGAHPNVVKLRSKDAGVVQSGSGRLDLEGDAMTISDDQWRQIIERELFGVPSEAEGISGRVLMSFLARRAASKGFVSPNRTHDRQSDAEGTAHQAYLLGLDWRLAYRYRLIAAQETARRELAKAASDPLWGRVVGKTSELRAKISLAEDKLRRLEDEASTFTVLQNFEEEVAEAATLEAQLRQVANSDTIDRRALKEIELALAESVEPDSQHLEQVWRELTSLLNEAIERQFDEVKKFHRSVLRNRRRYLEQERVETSERMAQRASERGVIGARHAEVLRRLSGAQPFQSLMNLHSAISDHRADLDVLRRRFDAAKALEARTSEIRAARAQLEVEIQHDLGDRREILDEIQRTFHSFASRLYGAERLNYLTIEPTTNHLRISPFIESDDSIGVGNMAMFCLDLTVASVAMRTDRAPDFLIHDSHMFDGVDQRQVALALNLARDVGQSVGLQYIVTMNSDELQKAADSGFDPADAIVDIGLTDEFADGGLFGFRFDSRQR